MLLSESSIRKIILSLLTETNRGLRISSMNQYLPPGEKEFDNDGETSAEEYIEAKDANVAGLKPKTLEFVARLNSYAKEKNWKKPKVTSGFRGPVSQAKVMFKNWKLHGGASGGTKYLIKLYADDRLAKKVGDSFTSSGSWQNAAEILKKEPVSAHGSGKAIDLRSRGHKNIGKIIHAVAVEFRNKGTKVSINDETGYKNPHWHVKIG